ncbi:MAG: MFS transporter [Planctomycetota bacterium]
MARRLFLLNLPMGLLFFALAAWLLDPDPPGEKTPAPFDLLGYLLLIGWIIPLVVMVDMGQYWGWTNSPFFVPWLAMFLVAAFLFVVWGLFASEPLINLHPFRVRNFSFGILVKVIFSINMYVQLSFLGTYMTDLRGYQWWEGALVLVFGAAAMLTSILAGLLWTGHRTRKARMGLGLVGMASATWLLSYVDLYTSKVWIACVIFLWALAAGIVVVPALLTIFEDLSPAQVFRSAGVFNIMRSIPAFAVGTLGVAWFTQTADGNFDLWRLDITHNRPIVRSTSRRLEQHFRERGSASTVALKQTHATLGQWVHANSKAYAFGSILGYLALLTFIGSTAAFFVRAPDPRLTPPRELLHLAFGTA